MTNLPEDMRERVSKLMGYWSPDGFDAYPDKTDKIIALLEETATKTEKAYGDCHNCYGKGYATRQANANGRVDIPQSPMVFCKCDRGKQLEAQFKKIDRKARIDELKNLVFNHSRTYKQTVTDREGSVYIDDTHSYISMYETQERIAALSPTKESTK